MTLSCRRRSVVCTPTSRCLGGMLELMSHCHFVVATRCATLRPAPARGYSPPMTRRDVALLLILTGAAPFTAAATAQSPNIPQNSAPGPLPVSVGQVVWVTVRDGFEFKGVISGVTATSIDVRGDAGTKHLNASEIRRIATTDSLKNGFWIGFAVGAVPAAAMSTDLGTGVGHSTVGQQNHQDDRSGVQKTLGPVVVGGLFGLMSGGIGALIDRAIGGRRMIYEPPDAAPAVRVGPIVTGHGLGLWGTIRW